MGLFLSVLVPKPNKIHKRNTNIMPNARYNENKAYLSNKFVAAFLETISKSEGTNGDYNLCVYGVVTQSPRFPSLVGKVGKKGAGVRVPDLKAYPFVMVKVNNSGLFSSAFGKYQVIQKTYNGLAKTLALTDFSELTQDVCAVELMRQRGALPYILKGDIQGAITKTSLPLEWASIVGNNYGQGTHSVSKLAGWFNDAVNSGVTAGGGLLKSNGGALGAIVAGVAIAYFLA